VGWDDRGADDWLSGALRTGRRRPRDASRAGRHRGAGRRLLGCAVRAPRPSSCARPSLNRGTRLVGGGPGGEGPVRSARGPVPFATGLTCSGGGARGSFDGRVPRPVSPPLANEARPPPHSPSPSQWGGGWGVGPLRLLGFWGF